ncbi:MAG: penicillin acylase family protein [Nitrospirota bacterium]|nr:MAG: penicillin acylase family protein [Nitrospirota bacterium]
MNFPKLIFALLFGRRLPITSGKLEVSGVKKSVLIRRDEYGIPYIEAKGDEDAWYGLGFCHGQDRAFQLEGLLRVVRGTLAELSGPAALPVDRLSRRIGFFHSAEKHLQVLDHDVLQNLEAYAKGVTDGTKLGCRRLAHEFTLLRTQPTPYQAADALGAIKLMSFLAASNWDCELARLKILTEDGPEALAALDPTYPEWHPVTSPPGGLAGEALDRLSDDLAIFTANVGQVGGSNNWAIAPSHTSTGRTILANDPHLPSVLPPHWYLAHIRTSDWTVAGASFVGGPSFPAGHNETAAWGVTFGFVDNTDLFIEEIGADGQSVRNGDDFIPCETRLETIHVKGGKSVEEKVLVTPRGPIISPALEGEFGAISLRATWLDLKPVRGLLQIHRSESFEEFRSAFEQWPGPSLNMVYADTSGAIGWQLAGEAPKRRKGWGTLPLAGWDAEVGWEKLPVPFDEMPHLADPETGFVATANNKPTIEDESPFLGTDWIDGYRLARIAEVLEARKDWDVASTQALQMDQKSLLWHELRDTILTVSTSTDEIRKALVVVEGWDGWVAADSTAATVFQIFIAEMVRRVAEAKAPRSWKWALGKGFTLIAPHSNFILRRGGHFARLVREQPAGWFDHPWSEEVADALTAVIRTLEMQYGTDPDKWAWGHIRSLTLKHPVGKRALFAPVFNLGPFAWGGDTNTVGQATVDTVDPTANPPFIASLRMVVDVGLWNESRFVLPGGQSGNPLSPHYDDQLALWQRGEGLTMAWSEEKIEQTTRYSLRLEPKQAQMSTSR